VAVKVMVCVFIGCRRWRLRVALFDLAAGRVGKCAAGAKSGNVFFPETFTPRKVPMSELTMPHFH